MKFSSVNDNYIVSLARQGGVRDGNKGERGVARGRLDSTRLPAYLEYLQFLLLSRGYEGKVVRRTAGLCTR